MKEFQFHSVETVSEVSQKSSVKIVTCKTKNEKGKTKNEKGNQKEKRIKKERLNNTRLRG